MAYLGGEPDTVNQFICETQDYLDQQRLLFVERLAECPQVTVYPSSTSYLLMQLPAPVTAGAMCEMLARQYILIRDCSNFHGLSERFIRVALKSPEVNQMAAEWITRGVLRAIPEPHENAVKGCDKGA